MVHVRIGKRIREERLRLNLTQAELAEVVGVTPAYIGQLERGEKNATLDKLISIATRLQVTVDYLLQDYVDSNSEQYTRLILQLIHDKPVQEMELAYRILKTVFDCYEETTLQNMPK